MLLAAAGWALWARRLADPAPRSQVREPLTAALTTAMDDVAQGSDTAQAVIRAYARMERVLADKGVPRRPSEAPFEYLGRALVMLGASAPAADRLTALFELAKFSRHEIDVDMRDEAVAALGDVRAQLEAGR